MKIPKLIASSGRFPISGPPVPDLESRVVIDEDRIEMAFLGLLGLAQAYGPDEPEYFVDDLKSLE